MAYNAQYDLRGKRIQDTYTQVVQYDTSSGAVYTGQGGSIDNFSSSFSTTASFASTAAFARNATSASYAPSTPNISASYAAQADHATLAAGLDEGASGASSSLYGPFLSGEVSIDGITTNRALYLDQYSVVKSSTMTNNDLGFATGLTSNVQEQLDSMRTGSGVDTASYAIKAATATGVQGEPNVTTTVTSVGSGRLDLWGNGMTATSVGTFVLSTNGDIKLSSSFQSVKLAGPDSVELSSSGVYIIPNDTTSEDGKIYMWSWEGGTFQTMSVNDVGFLMSNLGVSNLSAGSTITAQGNIVSTFGSISASVGFHGNIDGTASYANRALSASWAPGAGGGTTLVTASTYDITSSWAVYSDSASYVKTIEGGLVIESGSLVTVFDGYKPGVSVGGIDIESNDQTNGTIGWNAISIDGASTWVKRVDGSSGLISVSAPSLYIQMSPSNTSGSSAITATQIRVNGIDNTVALGGALIGTGFSYGNPVMLVSGSNRVTVSGSISASLGFTGSLFGTASNAISASWAPSSGGGTTLVTASTYDITSSWALNVVNASNQVSVSWASASISASYASQSSYAFTANFATATDFATNASLAQNALVAEEASSSISSSWASASISSSYSEYSDFALESDIASTATTASWASASFVATSASFASRSFSATSASWASASISSSYSVTASCAANAAGTVLVTGSVYDITASWAINVVNGGGSGNASTQSSIDISMKDMQFPFTAAFAGITPALLAGSSFDNNNFSRTGNGSVNGLVFWYLQFRNENIAGGNEVGLGLTASLAFHQMRVPVSYNSAGGLTHSFQYFAMGTVDGAYSPIEGEIPGANNRVYWNVDLYSLTSSTATTANFFSAPILVGTNIVTQSFSGAIHESGSMETVTSMFSGPSLTNDCMFFINVKRINSDSSSIYDPGTPVGDRTDYTGSVAMVSSRVSFNTM